MTDAGSAAAVRLYGIAQFLMKLAANGQRPVAAPARGIVTGDDVVDAVLQIADVLERAVLSEAIPLGDGVHAMSMLMLIRDYVRPLPVGLPADAGEGAADMVTGDLLALARDLRRTGAETGFQG